MTAENKNNPHLDYYIRQAVEAGARTILVDGKRYQLKTIEQYEKDNKDDKA
jgi:hypothetical protein